MHFPIRPAVAALLALALPHVALAQSVGVEIETEHRRRGLGWSDGEASASAYAEISPVAGASMGINATMLRGSRRHDGADAVVDLNARLDRDLGSTRLSGEVVAHVFPGRAHLDYVELAGGAMVTLAVVQLKFQAAYAPRQSAIGGDNLYLGIGASAGLPGTPFTLSAGVGRSSGHSDRPDRAVRLRPDGRYADWRVGIDWMRGRWTAGVRYTDTSIDAGAATTLPGQMDDSGARVTARLGFAF